VLNLLVRYFLRKLKKVKKSNGQILALNEVSLTSVDVSKVSFPENGR
jgi:Ribosomal proteins 50S-L18Ae/60S-L20/60S-L18A